ncbi:MAG: Sterol desaturase [Bacteroidota bacterium]|nr:Sterol desaturase [Bacteroidota bacterium]
MSGNLTIVIATPVFLVMVLLEYFAMRKKNKDYYHLNDAITNLNIGVGHVVSKVVVGVFLVWMYHLVYEHARLFTIPSGVLSFIFCLVAYDFFFYWAHRLGHRMNIFWGAHGVHHQSEYYNLAVALRQSWVHAALAFVIFLPIPFLGVDPVTFFSILSINSFYQFWIHTDVINRMPKWFEAIFNSPTHHRVHHGRDEKYIDKNHAGMFIVFDKWFGTFQEEEETPNYGVTKPINSWNPVWANVEYYVNMVQTGKKFSSWKDKLKYIVAKPGWQPDELGGEIPIPKVEQEYKRFNSAPTNTGLSIYVLVQFAFIVIGLVSYLYHYDKLPVFYKVLGFWLVMLSTVICGAIMEQKKWVKYAEYGRLLLILFGLNTLYYLNFNSWFYVMLIPSVILGAYFLTWFTLNINNKFVFKNMAVNRIEK